MPHTAAINAALVKNNARIQAIMELPEAKGREKTALKLALSNMPVEAAADLLSDLPKETASAFLDAMEAHGHVNIGTAHGAGSSHVHSDAKARRRAELRQNIAPLANARKG